MKSKIITLALRDLVNGLFVAILTAILTGIIDILGNGVVFDWIHNKPILIAGIIRACTYLLKSFPTNSSNQLLSREPI